MPEQASDSPRRASGSEERQRRASVPVRYSEEEKAEVLRRAERSNLTPSAYVRMQVLETPPPRAARRPSVETQQLARLLGQIGKIGSNVNQIAAAANVGEPPTEAALMRALDDIAQMRAAVMEALGRTP